MRCIIPLTFCWACMHARSQNYMAFSIAQLCLCWWTHSDSEQQGFWSQIWANDCWSYLWKNNRQVCTSCTEDGSKSYHTWFRFSLWRCMMIQTYRSPLTQTLRNLLRLKCNLGLNLWGKLNSSLANGYKILAMWWSDLQLLLLYTGGISTTNIPVHRVSEPILVHTLPVEVKAQKNRKPIKIPSSAIPKQHVVNAPSSSAHVKRHDIDIATDGAKVHDAWTCSQIYAQALECREMGRHLKNHHYTLMEYY